MSFSAWLSRFLFASYSYRYLCRAILSFPFWCKEACRSSRTNENATSLGTWKEKGPSSSSSESKAKKHDPPPPAADQLCLLATLYNEGVDIKCSSISTWSIICSRQTRLFIDGWWRTIHIEAALGPVRKVRDEVYTIFGLRCGGS